MAVYTDVPDEELKAFIAEYAIGEVVSCKGIAEGVENSNYLLRTESAAYILTLYEKRVDPADLPFFLALMEHLAAQGIACPTPIHGKDGKALAPALRQAGGDRELPRRHVAAAHPSLPLRRSGRSAGAAAPGGRRRSRRAGPTTCRSRAGRSFTAACAPRADDGQGRAGG